MKDELAKYVATGKIAGLRRPHPSNPMISGYLLGLSNKLALVHQFIDFRPDGYCLLRVADIAGIERRNCDAWWDHMLESEGLLSGLDLPHDIALKNMRTAIESIGRLYDQIVIECEEPDEDLQDFYLGELVDTDEEIVRLRSYDSMGYWATELDEIELDEITVVQFDTPYIRIFSKYTREGTPPDVPDDDDD